MESSSSFYYLQCLLQSKAATFFSRNNLINIALNVAPRFIIACGVSGCLITKGTDLSAGRMVGLSACLAGTLLQKPDYSGKFFQNLPDFESMAVLGSRGSSDLRCSLLLFLVSSMVS